MILSKKGQQPKTSKAADMRSLTNAMADSGIRFGTQQWVITLSSKDPVVDPVLEAGDVLTVNFDGVPVTEAFATDTATTLSNYAVTIAAVSNVAKAEVTGFTIEVTVTDDIEIALDTADVTNSTTTQLVLDEVQELRLVPALFVMNQDALEPLRVEVLTDHPVAGTNTTYLGWAAAGADVSKPVWKISEITEVTGATATTTRLYADGDEKMDNVWNDRATLSYS